jgi:membrane associated rhomboid family serine protease
MGYEDRDYIREKPRFAPAPKPGKGVVALLVLTIFCYLVMLVLGNATAASDKEFWAADATANANVARHLFIFTPLDLALWHEASTAGIWKIATHWLAASGLFAAVILALFTWLTGRYVEEAMGTRRFFVFFVGSAVVSGLLAALTELPLLYLGTPRLTLVMGTSGAIAACFTSMIWLKPDARWFFGWPIKTVVIVLLSIGFVLGLLNLFNKNPIVPSFTQVLWGAAVGALWMLALKRMGRLPKPVSAKTAEPWSEAGYLNDYRDEEADPKAEAKRKKGEAQLAKLRNAAIAEQQKLDALLEKISKTGINSLSRAEKKFLDEQSKKKSR